MFVHFHGAHFTDGDTEAQGRKQQLAEPALLLSDWLWLSLLCTAPGLPVKCEEGFVAQFFLVLV